jgi:hypothetical protein
MFKRKNVIYIKVTNLFTYDVDLKVKTKEDWLSFLREKNWWSLHKEVLFNKLTS